MAENELSLVIGGDAGQGIQSTGLGFIQALARAGLYPFGRQDYRSRIRGGHNFFEIRISDRQIYTHTEGADLLVALTKDSVDKHLRELTPGGGIIYDEKFGVKEEELLAEEVKPLPIPLEEIAREEGGAKVMANTAAVGAILGLTGLDFSYVSEIIQENFAPKGDAVVQNNLDVAEAGRDYVRSKDYDFDHDLSARPDQRERMVINGNQAFAFGAVVGGCNFVSAYPMTPSTSILEWISKHAEEFDIVTKQPESEIAAINIAIGASHVGGRPLVTTSGGGFSLMVEALGLAGTTETPLVLAEVQRPGPSTGLPTRTEQGDLLAVISASQGDFPRIVMAPATIEEAFQAGKRAFNLAEKYQLPVIVLSDQHLADSIRAIPPEEFDTEVEINRGNLLNEGDLENRKNYLRHEFTDSGISPRVLPGNKFAPYKTTGNEHDEKGDVTEDPEVRSRMMEKRMRKLNTAVEVDIQDPKLFGPEEAEVTFLCWGSTFGAVREVVESLNKTDNVANFYHVHDLYPMNGSSLEKIVRSAETVVLVENNYSGQLGKLVAEETGIKLEKKVLKYDGRPFTPEDILTELKQIEEVPYDG